MNFYGSIASIFDCAWEYTYVLLLFPLLTGFTGRNCDVTLTTGCSSAPCLSGSTCVSMGTGGQYTCQCVEGYTGFHCEENINDCTNTSCEEFQVCVDLISSFR